MTDEREFRRPAGRTDPGRPGRGAGRAVRPVRRHGPRRRAARGGRPDGSGGRGARCIRGGVEEDRPVRCRARLPARLAADRRPQPRHRSGARAPGQRRRRRRRRALAPAHRPEPDLGGRAAPRRRRPRSARRSTGLPDEQRRALELAYFEGYTYREVAEQTGVAPGTAAGRLRLGLAKLREALAGSSGAPLPALEPDAATRTPGDERDELRPGRRAGRRLCARSGRGRRGPRDQRTPRDLRPAARRGARAHRCRRRGRGGRGGGHAEPGAARSPDGDRGDDAAGAPPRRRDAGARARARAEARVVAAPAGHGRRRRRGAGRCCRPRRLGAEPERPAGRARRRAAGRRQRRGGVRGVTAAPAGAG